VILHYVALTLCASDTLPFSCCLLKSRMSKSNFREYFRYFSPPALFKAHDLFCGFVVLLENTKDFQFFFYTNLLYSFILMFVKKKTHTLEMYAEMSSATEETAMDNHLKVW
jgi:hypothetical protein